MRTREEIRREVEAKAKKAGTWSATPQFQKALEAEVDRLIEKENG